MWEIRCNIESNRYGSENDATNYRTVCRTPTPTTETSTLQMTLYRDSDNDGLFNEEEAYYGTNILDSDTDKDGITDYKEIFSAYKTVYSSADHPDIPDMGSATAGISIDYAQARKWAGSTPKYVKDVKTKVRIYHTCPSNLEIYFELDVVFWFPSGVPIREFSLTKMLYNYQYTTSDYIELELSLKEIGVPIYYISLNDPLFDAYRNFLVSQSAMLFIKDTVRQDAGKLDYFMVIIEDSTDPLCANSDGDYWSDFEEVTMGTCPIRYGVTNWAVHVHPEDIEINWDTGTFNTYTLDKIADIGATFVRIDFPWDAFQPEQSYSTNNQLNPKAVTVYNNLLTECEKRGLGVIAVVGTGWPSWVTDVYNAGLDFEKFYPVWKSFARLIAQQFGDSVYFYQLFNEENHPINAHLRAEDVVGALNAGHDSIHEVDSACATIVNAFADWIGWADEMNKWANSEVDILAIDHYPGTWTSSWYDDWGPLDSLFAIANAHGKKCAIMETGFSTWGAEDTPSWCLYNYWHTQDDQRIFINTALPVILSKSVKQNTNNPNNKIVLFSWYELRDNAIHTAPSLWPLPWFLGALLFGEDNFGILTLDLHSKMGYSDLQYQINNFYRRY